MKESPLKISINYKMILELSTLYSETKKGNLTINYSIHLLNTQINYIMIFRYHELTDIIFDFFDLNKDKTGKII
jgi:hypothetical protein